MDRYLFAYNPLKTPKLAKPEPCGYIIDTVNDVWFDLVKDDSLQLHTLSLVKSTQTYEQNLHTALRASRWYNSWLIKQGLEVDVNFDLKTKWQKTPSQTQNQKDDAGADS